MPTIAEQWVQQGCQQGLQQGLHRGEAAVLVHLVERKLRPLSDVHRRRIDEADAETLLRWSERILWARNLEEVLAD